MDLDPEGLDTSDLEGFDTPDLEGLDTSDLVSRGSIAEDSGVVSDSEGLYTSDFVTALSGWQVLRWYIIRAVRVAGAWKLQWGHLLLGPCWSFWCLVRALWF